MLQYCRNCLYRCIICYNDCQINVKECRIVLQECEILDLYYRLHFWYEYNNIHAETHLLFSGQMSI